jgi:peptidoglycan/LPS O-acetylase OafA/YrhL
VLSGYLIANQLFAGIARGQSPSIGSFYLRRALRTLPLFWLVLAAYFLWPAALGGKPLPLWRFLTFTQNLGLQPGTAFSHAWLLCVEEQFYLALPLVLAFGVRARLRPWHGWLSMAALLALGVGARTLLWFRYGRENGPIENYYPWVYYATLTRFDEFLPGIAVALVKHFHAAQWQRLMRHGQALLAAGLAASGTMLYLAYNDSYIEGYGYGFFWTAFGYSLLAMAFAVLMLAALSPHTWLHRLRVPRAGSLALWSYAIYLSHKPLAHLAATQLKPLALSPGTLLAMMTLACLALGALLHRWWRCRCWPCANGWLPSNFAGPLTLPPSAMPWPRRRRSDFVDRGTI